MRGKIQPTDLQGWPRTWIEVGSKLGIFDYNSIAYWFISSCNLSHNHDGTLNKNSLKVRFSAIGKPSGIVNLLFPSLSQPSYAANCHVMAQWCHTFVNTLVSVDQLHIPSLLHAEVAFLKVKQESEQLLWLTDLLPLSQLSILSTTLAEWNHRRSTGTWNHCERRRSKP